MVQKISANQVFSLAIGGDLSCMYKKGIYKYTLVHMSFQTFSPCLYFTAFAVDITANTTTRNLTAMFVVVIIRSASVYLLNYYENSVDEVKEKIIKV